jgi:alpha-glucosidase
MDYVGQKPGDALELDVYPDGESAFTLYEDDGISYDYLQGAVAETHITCNAGKDGISLAIAPRRGAYAGMPEERRFAVRLHAARPRRLLVNGQPAEWSYDDSNRTINVHVVEDAMRQSPAIVECRF